MAPWLKHVHPEGLLLVQACALVAFSAVVLVAPGFPIASAAAPLAVTAATLESAAGLTVLVAQLLHFKSEGRLRHLFTGLGFAAVAMGSFTVRVAGSITGLAVTSPRESSLLILLSQILAAGAFAAGLASIGRIVPPAQRGAVARRAVILSSLVMLVGFTIVSVAGANLGAVMQEPIGWDAAATALVSHTLPGQEPWLKVVHGVLAVFMLGVALGYTRAWLRMRHPDVAVVAAALCILCASQFHAALFPPVAVHYFSTADGLRLIAVFWFTGALTSRLGSEVARRAAREERLRLSRELHDGLAQQLSLLQLRLRRAATTERTADDRARDLETAQRLTQVALIEARRVIKVLRAGSFSWDDLVQAITTLADEFATENDVQVRVECQGCIQQVDAEFHRHVSYILQEALSNAVRHGGASRIAVNMITDDRNCELTIRDNGSGFDPTANLARTGVGLDSMAERLQGRGGRLSIDSRPGAGTTVWARLPVAR